MKTLSKLIYEQKISNKLTNKQKISKVKEILKEGNVVTVEPGLYYSNIGGVRIEDTVVIEKSGIKNLTKFPKFFEV